MRTTLLLLAIFMTFPARAQDFRIENEVFSEGSSEPLFRTLTLFRGDYAYDFSFASEEEEKIEQATLYDFRGKRFILVDYVSNLKTEIDQESILRFLSQLQVEMKEKGADQLLREAANPKFEVTREEGVIKLTGTALKYEVHTLTPETKAAASAYQRFADWSARLTTLQGGPPPMARIAVNKEVAQDGLMPKEVSVWRSSGPIWENAKKLRSNHQVNWLLTATDRKRIEMLETKMADMETLSWKDYKARIAAGKNSKKQR